MYEHVCTAEYTRKEIEHATQRPKYSLLFFFLFFFSIFCVKCKVWNGTINIWYTYIM